MASSTPGSPAADAKPREPATDKSEVNGQTPTAKSTTESKTVNGDESAKTSQSPVTNGVSEDVQMANGDDSELKKPDEDTKLENAPPDEPKTDDNQDKSEKPPSDESRPKEEKDEKKDEEPPAPKESESEAPQTEEPKPDVEMADASQPDDKDASKTDDATDKTPVAPSEKDSEMADKPDEPKTEGETTKSADAAAPTSEVSLSQLAIESTDPDPAQAKPSIEVVMGDAPDADLPQNTKVAREREDDATDEPAPKRARTEPKEEDTIPTTTTTATTTAASAPPSAPTDANLDDEPSPLASSTNWNDEAFNAQKITQYQRREIRKVLGRVKKTKHGGHFKDSVQKLWPGLWESYLAKIEKPTDLSEIDRTMRDTEGPYVTIENFKNDLALMYENTRTFNGPSHEITAAAQGAIRSIWEDVVHIPQEEPVKPKPVPKQKPPREPRAIPPPPAESAVRKPLAAPSGSPAPLPTGPKPTAPSQDPISELRRASTEGDRPKRTVRAPKPKDIDYTTKPSRKKLRPELQFCEEVLSEIMHPRNKYLNSWFMEPVDAEGLNVPQYYSIIKKPMDLGKVSRMLAGGDIQSAKEFDKTIRLIFTNCYTFNGPVEQGNTVSYVAKQLEDFYTDQMKQKDSWIAKHAKANAPAPTSHASDDEEEEEDAEGEDATNSAVDHAKEVRELEAKLREESGKLTDLFAADSPNQSLITVQQGIFKMVQEALLKAKATLSDARQKGDKPGKKASKPSKPKAAGGTAARKPTGAAANPKKSGTKKASKKTLTAADKDLIANAINDLEYPHLDKAIDIIKRDTGQNENNDGELELDIDQLSNDALLKLWDVCKKVLPGFGKDSAAPPSPEVTRSAPSKASKQPASSKPKKNKPMSAREQEERIAQLRGLRDLYKPGQDGDGQSVIQAPTPTAESSDDSDSEEE